MSEDFEQQFSLPHEECELLQACLVIKDLENIPFFPSWVSLVAELC